MNETLAALMFLGGFLLFGAVIIYLAHVISTLKSKFEERSTELDDRLLVIEQTLLGHKRAIERNTNRLDIHTVRNKEIKDDIIDIGHSLEDHSKKIGQAKFQAQCADRAIDRFCKDHTYDDRLVVLEHHLGLEYVPPTTKPACYKKVKK